jgi:hypothetical protein
LDAARELGKRDGVVRSLEADVIASRIYRAIGGWREHVPVRWVKDAGAVRGALEGLSKAEAGLVQRSYEDLTGRALKQDLVAAFGVKRAAPLFLNLHAEDSTETALVLKRTLESSLIRLRGKQELIREIYQSHSPGEIKRFEQELSRRINLSGGSIKDYIASKVSPSIAREVAAYRDGDPLRGLALQFERSLRSWLGGWRAADILQTLRPDQRQAFQDRYLRETGEKAQGEVLQQIKPSPLRDLCLAILDGDARRIQAAEIACAFAYRREFIAARFLGLSKEQRDTIIRDYEATYAGGDRRGRTSAVTGDFAADLRRSVWRSDYSILSTLPGVCRALDRSWWPITGSYPFVVSAVRSGGLAPAELLRYFMVGLGTDVEGIYAVLSNRSYSDIRAIEHDYAKRYPPGSVIRWLGRVPLIRNFILTGDLRKDLDVELSGDSEFDVQQMLLGFRDNLTPKQLCVHVFSSLVLRRYHETSGIFAKWSRLASVRGDSFVKRRYDADFRAAEEYFNAEIAPVQKPTTACVVRFLFLARLTEIQATSFRETKNLLGDLLLNSGAVLGVVLSTAAVLSLATFSYPIVATASFVGSLAWRLAMGRCILGRGFGKGEIIFQAARALIDGLTIFTVRTGLVTLGQFIGGQLSKTAAKGGFKTGFNSMIKKMEGRVRRQDKARHVLERRSVVRSNEDLRSSVRAYAASLRDTPWPIGEGASERFPPIEQVMGVREAA